MINHVQEIVESYKTEFGKVMCSKILKLSSDMEKKGEFRLSEVLLGIATDPTAKSIDELNEMGYYLDTYIPEFHQEWDEETMTATAKIDLSKIAITLKRIVAEA